MKNIFEKYKGFEITWDTSVFRVKNPVIFGYRQDVNAINPIMYLTKPKHISKEEFKLFLEQMTIYVSKYTEDKNTIDTGKSILL